MSRQVQARPAALEHFEERARELDLRVARTLDGARDALGRYLASCEDAYVADPRDLLDDLETLLEHRVRTAAAIGDLGRAFAAMDRPGWQLARGDERGLEHARVQGAHLPADFTEWLVGHDPRRWHALLSGVVGGTCLPFRSGSYLGSGFLRGPDGSLYPLVVPEVVVDGRHRNAAGRGLTWEEVETLHGEDDGWVDVARRSGTTRFGPEPTLVTSILAAMVGTNPNLVPATRPIPRQAVDTLGFGDRGLTGVATVPKPTRLELPPPGPKPTYGPPTPGGTLGGNPAGIGRPASGALGRRPLGRAPGSQARVSTATAGVDAIVTLGESLALATSMRDHGLAHVDVRFQKTPDGRRRAVARSITGRTGAQGTVLRPTYLTADEEGRLRPEPMRADPHPTLGDPARPLLADWGQLPVPEERAAG